MNNFILVLILSTVCAYAYPLIEEETSNEHLPIGYDVGGQTDEQLVPNIEENQNLIDNDVQPEDLTPLVEPDDLSALVQPALDLNRDLQTNFKVENWNGGTVNTGLSIGTAYFISDIHCSGTQCSVRLT